MPGLVSWRVFDVLVLEERDGFISFIVEGSRSDIFTHESGTHVWQRVSPTEKKGRVHTSLITVAVLPVPDEQELDVKEYDLDITAFCASTNGGQHMQKNATAVRVVHKPTGIVASCQSERSQWQNKMNAIAVVRARIKEAEEQSQNKSIVNQRREQIGYGGRGEKIRTIRVKDNTVMCHKTNRNKLLKDYFKGKIIF